MKIKTKLRLGFGFLFVIVLTFGLISLMILNELADKSKVILKDNYESLKYVSAMRYILDQQTLPLSKENQSRFESAIAQEMQNITESGEKKAAELIRSKFYSLLKSREDTERQLNLRQLYAALHNVEAVNLKAIFRKNEQANAVAARANIYIAISATFCFLILFTFIVNFPGFVANPLAAFSSAIRQISNRNYNQRLHFDNDDEFSELAAAFNTMATKLNEWENSNLSILKSEKLRIEAIITQMQDGIIGVNERGEILFLNTIASKLLNLDADQNIGRNVSDLQKKNELLDRILSPGKDKAVIKIYADNRESYFQLDYREIIIPNLQNKEENTLVASTRSAGSVYMLRNITQFKELDEAKTNFIATVSHELKTPLSSIKMSLKLLKDERIGQINTEQQELIQHIQEDSERLLKITGELLDLSQAETGNLKLSFTVTKPLEIVSYALNAVRFQAEQKQISLEVLCNEELPSVYADIQKTAWVLVNFLSNALRYSAEKSKIYLAVELVKDDIVFSVRDFGKGIEEQYQKRLFDRYFQVPTDGQNKSGSGLGLAISKDFIEAEKGRIWVESALGEGSVFSFALPKVSTY